jgi:hypothetical protein
LKRPRRVGIVGLHVRMDLGEWRSTKRFMRADYTDVGESQCILQYNEHLPGTALGSATAEERGKSEVEGNPNGK